MYRYYCETENKQIYDNQSIVPTKCKNNINHCVDWSSLVKYYQYNNCDNTSINNLQTQVNNMQIDVTANTNRRNETTTVTENITSSGSSEFNNFALNITDSSIQYGDIIVSGTTLDGTKNACFKFQIIFKKQAGIISKVNQDLILSLSPTNLNWTCDVQIISNNVAIILNSNTDTVKWKHYTVLL